MEEDDIIPLSPNRYTAKNDSDIIPNPPSIFSSLPLPLLAFSLLKPQHKESLELQQITSEAQKEDDISSNAEDIKPTPEETKEETEENEDENKEENKSEGLSWYERIKTAAISGTTGIANATAKIKYAFISKDTEEAFLQIWELMNMLLKDVPFNKLDLLFGLMMLQEYYKAIPVRSQLTIRDQDLVFTARHYMKYSGACFGHKYIQGMILKSAGGLLQGMVGGDQANINSLCDYCEITPEDVVVSKYFKDCLTDLVAHSEAFQDGWVHKGFYTAATRKLEQLESTILECLRHHPLYEFVVTGHSMGAGIGAIFTLLFHEAHPEVQIHCYAFGTPCIFSPELALAPTTVKLITTFVLGDDVVPQLSFESMSKLKGIIMQILSQSNNSLQRAFHWVASNNALSDNTLTRIASILQCTPKPEMLTQTQTPSLSQSLYPPGNIYHIFKRVETTTTTTTTTSVSPSLSSSSSSSSSLSSSPVSSTFITHDGEDSFKSSGEIPISTVTETVQEVKLEFGETPGSFPKDNDSNNTTTIYKNEIPNPPTITKVGSPVPELKFTRSISESEKEKENQSSTSAPITPTKPSIPPSPSPSILNPLSLPIPSIPSIFKSLKTPPPTPPLVSPQISPRTGISPREGEAIIKTTREEKELGYDLEKSNPSLFHEIFISPSMFLDHMPHMYEHALQVMVDEYSQETKGLKDSLE